MAFLPANPAHAPVVLSCVQVVDAITCYRKALSLKPDFPDAFANLVHSLVFICDWRTRDLDFRKLSDVLRAQMASSHALPCVQPFHALVYPLSLSEMQAIASRYAQRALANVALLELPPFRYRTRPRDGRLRIGYVSSDFGNHPLAHLMQSVFGMHDRER